VEAVHSGFSEAARRAAEHMPVEGTVWVAGDGVEIKPENRRGSLENVSNYIGEEDGRGFRISSGVIFRILASSVFALLLTWGTISAAMIIEYLTPTIGMFVFLTLSPQLTILYLRAVLSFGKLSHVRFCIHSCVDFSRHLQCSVFCSSSAETSTPRPSSCLPAAIRKMPGSHELGLDSPHLHLSIRGCI
jgi:hypothetical protein